MSKSMTAEQLKLMGLTEVSPGVYQKVKTKVDKAIELVDDINIASLKLQKMFDDKKTTNRSKVYVGIDPGKSGAICYVDTDGCLNKWVIPVSGKDVDAQALYDIIDGIKQYHDPVIVLEDVHSMYGMSANSNFQFGFVCGLIRAIVIVHRIPFHFVAPKTWQKVIWSTPDKVYKPKKPTQKNPSVDTKATSLNAAKRIFPNFDFTKNQRSRVEHDGIVDAILIAEFGRRTNL